MSGSFNGSRIGLGFSEERRAAQQRENRLRQELYAQQKKIQFSNLLERSGQDVDDYIGSQNNVFFASARNDDEDGSDAGQTQVAQQSGLTEPGAPGESYNADDRDGADFFSRHAFRADAVYRPGASQGDPWFDPAAPSLPSLREHLRQQILLDGKYANLDPEVKRLALQIIDLLDPDGYFRADPKYSGGSRSLVQGGVAWEEEDDDALVAIAQFDEIFGIESTEDQRSRARKALEDAAATHKGTKASRKLAKEEFDQIIGRKTTRDERERALAALVSLGDKPQNADPFRQLFKSPPTEAEREQAQKALDAVQSLDPPGSGARDLRESLLLRLRPDDEREEQLRIVISDHFDDFIKKRIGALATKTGKKHADIVSLYDAPFPFYPSPGTEFSREAAVPTRWIQPEIIVEKNAAGRWVARLDDAREDLQLDPRYQKMLFSKRVDKKTKDYLRRQYVEAQALLDALRNRNSTILRISKAIVDFQTEYFEDPTASPKPFTQQQVADKLGLDSSTVSRACADKWVSTPRGFVAFKDFFPKAVTGEATSSAIEDRIRAIIDSEDPFNPLSDADLAAQLQSRFGLDVSRKTVQEYRDRLRIPNSRSRKRLAVQSAAEDEENSSANQSDGSSPA